MNCVLISIGDELLIGQTINTNAAWLGEQLNLLGFKVIFKTFRVIENFIIKFNKEKFDLINKQIDKYC